MLSKFPWQLGTGEVLAIGDSHPRLGMRSWQGKQRGYCRVFQGGWGQLAEVAVRADQVAVSCNQCWRGKPCHAHLPSSGSSGNLAGNVW